MADYLIAFTEGQDIKASETNSNNQYILNKISDNSETVQNYIETQLALMQSNLFSIQKTLQNNIDNLSNKINETPHIIKRFDNGSTWYEIWSDGRCEQGGRVNPTSVRTSSNVKFPIRFINRNYYLDITSIDEASSDLGKFNYTAEAGATKNRTETGFTIIWNWGGRYWRACGKVNLTEVL